MQIQSFLTAALLLVLATPAWSQGKDMPQPVSHPQLEFVGDQVELKMMRKGGRSLVAVHVGDAGPFDFFIDTGAAVSVIDSRIAAELDLSVVGSVAVGAPGGEPVDSDIVQSPTLQVGELAIHNATLVSLEIAALTGGLMQGILGLDVFQDVLLTLDPGTARALLSRSELAADDPGVVQLVVSSGRIQFDMLVAGQTVKTQIDTGAPGDFTLPVELMDDVSTLEGPERQTSATLVGGTRTIRTRKLDGSILVAGLEYKNPDVGFMDPSPGTAHIGAGILDHLVISVDQRNNLLAFQRAESSPTVEASQGRTAPRRLGVRFRGTSSSSFTQVASVAAGSLGERVGFRSGDVLVSLNGKPMSSYDQASLGTIIRGTERLRWKVKRDGAPLVIEVP